MKHKEEDHESNKIYIMTFRGSMVLFVIIFFVLILRTTFCPETSFFGTELTSYDQVNDSTEVFLQTGKDTTVTDIKNAEAAIEKTEIVHQKKLINSLTADEKLVNINTASAEELTGLKGIGQVTAENIIKYRTENGSFKDIEELMNVRGIGKKRFSDIKSLIDI